MLISLNHSLSHTSLSTYLSRSKSISLDISFHFLDKYLNLIFFPTFNALNTHAYFLYHYNLSIISPKFSSNIFRNLTFLWIKSSALPMPIGTVKTTCWVRPISALPSSSLSTHLRISYQHQQKRKLLNSFLFFSSSFFPVQQYLIRKFF